MTDADYSDELASPKYPSASWIPAAYPRVSSKKHWLLCDANKTEFMCFKQGEAIYSLSSKPLKLVDQFTYLDSNISSTETYLEYYWQVVDHMEIWSRW